LESTKKYKRKAKMNTRNNSEKNNWRERLADESGCESEETEIPRGRKGVAMKEGSQKGPFPPVLGGT
jgi:hypothetical protein